MMADELRMTLDAVFRLFYRLHLVLMLRKWEREAARGAREFWVTDRYERAVARINDLEKRLEGVK